MTIEEESRRIRRCIPPLKPNEKRRFKPALKERILSWVERAKASGMREADCSRALGIPASQFNSWRRRSAPVVAEQLPMDWRVEPVSRELVTITIPSGIELTAGVVVVSPTGYRVEGLNLEQAYALLREFQ